MARGNDQINKFINIGISANKMDIGSWHHNFISDCFGKIVEPGKDFGFYRRKNAVLFAFFYNFFKFFFPVFAS